MLRFLDSLRSLKMTTFFNMANRYKSSLLRLGKLFVFLMGGLHVAAQGVEIGSVKDQALRMLQLQGKLDAKYSLMARPFFAEGAITSDSIYKLIDSAGINVTRKRTGDKGVLEIFPLTINSQLNTHHPYGWNQPGFVQANGWQGLITAGAYTAIGPLSIQVKPVVVYAANTGFEHTNTYGAVTKGSYSRALPGQSSIRLNAGAVSLGISTENLWWGPGSFNSLLMSNNTPGFLHLTFNSTRPVKTPIGNFEWQLVSGKLYEDTMLLREDKNLTTTYYNPKTYSGDGYSGPYDPKQKWRYFNGITITYQPKWIKGLFLGINRIAYAYNDSLQSGNSNFFHSYMPVIFGVFRESYTYGTRQGIKKRYKQMLSLHARYLFPQAHTEFYAEYGWGDNLFNIRDFALNVPHSTAYILGARKMIPLSAKNQWLDVQAELTRLSQPSDYIPRNAGNWYGYQGGYTQQSRIIGAGIGPGNNVQTFATTWVHGWKRLGIKLERLQHDPNSYPVYWSDYSVGFTGQQRFGKWIASSLLQFIQSKNYTWEAGKDRFNFYGTLNLTYVF